MTEQGTELFCPANSSLKGQGNSVSPPSPEGIAFAVGGLVLMAILPIVVFAFRSVSELEEQEKVCIYFFRSILVSLNSDFTWNNKEAIVEIRRETLYEKISKSYLLSFHL